MDLFEFLARQDEANRHLTSLNRRRKSPRWFLFRSARPPRDNRLTMSHPGRVQHRTRLKRVGPGRGFEPPDSRAIEQELLEGLNPQQYEAVLHKDGPMLVLAGADPARPWSATRRIAHLIEVAGVSPFAILAITFTNKAAREMKERIGELIDRSPTECGWAPSIPCFPGFYVAMPSCWDIPPTSPLWTRMISWLWLDGP